MNNFFSSLFLLTALVGAFCFGLYSVYYILSAVFSGLTSRPSENPVKNNVVPYTPSTVVASHKPAFVASTWEEPVWEEPVKVVSKPRKAPVKTKQEPLNTNSSVREFKLPDGSVIALDSNKVDVSIKSAF